MTLIVKEYHLLKVLILLDRLNVAYTEIYPIEKGEWGLVVPPSALIVANGIKTTKEETLKGEK